MGKQRKFPWMLDLWTMMWSNFGTGMMGAFHRKNNIAEMEKWVRQQVNQRFDKDQEWKDLTK